MKMPYDFNGFIGSSTGIFQVSNYTFSMAAADLNMSVNKLVAILL
jgi:hypothetical protein